MSEAHENSNPATWDPALDAVVAAPKHHRVIFENERLRVLEVTLEHEDEEPVHLHRWPSVFVFDQVQGPVHDMAPDGTQMPPNRDVMKAIQSWDGRGCLVVNMSPQPAGPCAQRFRKDDPRHQGRDEERLKRLRAPIYRRRPAKAQLLEETRL